MASSLWWVMILVDKIQDMHLLILQPSFRTTFLHRHLIKNKYITILVSFRYLSLALRGIILAVSHKQNECYLIINPIIHIDFISRIFAQLLI